jgi:hypothetical protein
MATTDRLRYQSPDLAAMIEGVPEAERASLVQQAVEKVAAMAGVADECRSTSDLDGLVARLDEEAWSLQAANLPSTDYERAFKRARAANAWLFAATDHSLAGSCEAIYEAVHALDGQPEQIAALLGGSA